MARPREFQIDDVLQKAMEVFWRRGYAATSMADIYAATGLKPGNLYSAFKDKEHLFRRCFEAYTSAFRSTLPADVSGINAIRSWIDLQAQLAINDPERKGCLIISTVTEREVHSEATRALANGRLQEIRDFFIRQLTEAKFHKEVSPDIVIDVQADSLLGTVVSIMALGRAGADRRIIENVASSSLEPLSPASK